VGLIGVVSAFVDNWLTSATITKVQFRGAVVYRAFECQASVACLSEFAEFS